MRDVNIAGRDVNTYNTSSEKKEKGKWLLAVVKYVIAPVLVVAILYVIFRWTGINLSDFKLQ